MLAVGSKVSHRFCPLHRNAIGEVISLEGHWFDGEQMVVVRWFDEDGAGYAPEHHHAECLALEV